MILKRSVYLCFDMLLGVMWAFLITETSKGSDHLAHSWGGLGRFYELQIVFCFHLEVKI